MIGDLPPDGTQASGAPSKVERSPGLTWLLALVLMAQGAVAIYLLTNRESVMGALPKLTVVGWWLLTASAITAASSALGIVFWRLWGVLALGVATVVTLVVNIHVRAPVAHSIMGPIAFGLVVWYLQPVWKHLR